MSSPGGQGTPPADRRTNIFIGALFTLAGIGIIVMMTVSPEGLNAPYWVAVAAASTFSFAGISVMLTALGFERAGRWLVVPTLFGLASPGLWILFDPAEKQCSASIGVGGGSIGMGAGDLVCRAVFGFGGALTLLIAVIAIATLVRRRAARRSENRESHG